MLKATPVLARLHWLGIKPSYSRPRVSDDNAHAESLFRTANYRPEFPNRRGLPQPGVSAGLLASECNASSFLPSIGHLQQSMDKHPERHSLPSLC
jgi:transposase InsO family protein